jgi:hypothetical protein
LLCRDDTIFAVKAPAGTTLEVPEPEFQRMDDGKLAQRYRWVKITFDRRAAKVRTML